MDRYEAHQLYTGLSSMGHRIDHIAWYHGVPEGLTCGLCDVTWRYEDDPALTVCQKNCEYLQKLVDLRQDLHKRGFCADEWPDEAVAEIERLSRNYSYLKTAKEVVDWLRNANDQIALDWGVPDEVVGQPQNDA